MTTTNWTYVGDGRGGYEKVQTYEFVGEGGGSFEKETTLLRYGVRPRACCVFLGFLVVLVGALYAIFGLRQGFHADWRSWVLVHRQIEGAGRAPKVLVQSDVKPRYNCVAGPAQQHQPFAPSSHAAICAAALLEAVWRAVELDGDGRIDRSDMLACEQNHLLSPNVFQVLKSGDTDGDGTLDVHEFAAVLSKAGLAVGETKGGLVDITSTALVEAAWLAMDKDGNGRIKRAELDVLQQQKHLSHRTMQVFQAVDGNSDGVLLREEFEAGLTKCGLSSFIVSRDSRAVLDVAIAEAAWAAISHDGGTVGKLQLEQSEDQELLPLPGLRALRVAFSHSSGVLTHGRFVAALVDAHLSGDFVKSASAAPAPAAPSASASALEQPEPIAQWEPAKRLWCCTNAGLGCADSDAARSSPPPPQYDCQAGMDQWAEVWEPAKKKWCCQYAKIGCAPYDCEDGYSDWLHRWSFGQKKWCCANTGRGCPPQTTSLPFDCSAGYARWATGWSREKKTWCCQHGGRGCPPVPVTQSFDCEAGLSNWVNGWSASKKEWCCQNFRKGCPFSGGQSHNCQEGLSTWQSTWSAAKKEWCCQHHGRGCPFDCNADYVPCYHCLMDRWSVAKRTWCCQHARRGCVTTTSLPFDCEQDLSSWDRSWTLPKKVWCCKHEKRGCPLAPSTTSAAARFDCEDGYAHWQTVWTPLKKAWCCQRSGRGCPATTSKPYDCKADYTTCHHCLKRRWSASKRRWCCHHEQLGCLTTAAPTPPPFDCNAAFVSWERAWSPGKKAWCCQHERRGCPRIDTSLPFDCSAGLENSERGWSAAKLRWCCANQRLGCKFDCRLDSSKPVHEWQDDRRDWCCHNFHTGCREPHSEAFDCLAGFSRWKDGWSKAKKAYCCQHFERGCPHASAENATVAQNPR